MTTQDDFDDFSNEARAQRLILRLEEFIRKLNKRAGEKHAAEVIMDGQMLDGEKIKQKPEWFIAENLIEPIGDILGYDLRFQPKGFDGLEGRIPDFTVLNLEYENFGEIKTPGKISNARKESVEYLDLAENRPLVGFATDGRVWILYIAGEGEDPVYTYHAPLHELLNKVRMLETSSAEGARHSHLRELGLKFVSEFNIEAVRGTIEQKS